MKLISILKLVAGILISLAVVILFSNRSLERAELSFYDWRLKHSYVSGSLPLPFAIIGSTENFESMVGEPLSRKFYAKTINILGKEGASVIGFDIFFPNMTGSAEDRDFMTALAKNRKVVLPVFSPTKITKREGIYYLVPSIRGSSEAFNRAACSLGHINTLPDEDQVIRKVPAFIKCGDTVYPQISLEIARIYRKQMKGSGFLPYRGRSIFGSHMPVRKDGSIYIRFLPPDEMAKYFISLEEVILGRYREGFFKNKVVIIGQASVGGKNADLVPTPLGTQFGVLLQGGILNNFLSDRYIYRVDGRAVSVSVVLLGALLGLVVFSCGIIANTLLLAGLAVLSFFLSLYAMGHAGLFVDTVPFYLLFFFFYFASLVYSLVNAVKKLFHKETAIRIMQDVEKEITTIINPSELPGITGDFASYGFEGTEMIKQTPEIAMRTLFASLGIEAGAFMLLHVPAKHQVIAQHGRVVSKMDLARVTQKALTENQPLIFNRLPGKNEWGENVKSIMILPLFSQPTFRIVGLFINKYPTPFSRSSSFSREDIPVIHTLSMQSLIAIQNARLNLALKETQMESIFRLSVAIEYRDRETGMHIHRVSEYSGLIARNIGILKNEVDLIKSAMPLHDIGKIAIPDHILLKQGKLTPEERKIVEQHPIIGAKMLAGSDSLLLKVSETIALYHHEKYDGSGYPFHLRGNSIPLYGRIAAIADIFDAMSSKRIYKEAVSLEESFAFLQKETGTIFDPRMTEGFVKQEYEIKKIRETYKDVL